MLKTMSQVSALPHHSLQEDFALSLRRSREPTASAP